jgi:hypothetical protein
MPPLPDFFGGQKKNAPQKTDAPKPRATVLVFPGTPSDLPADRKGARSNSKAGRLPDPGE